jgi:hypothetical protein
MSFGADPTRLITQPNSSLIKVLVRLLNIKIKASMNDPLYMQEPNPIGLAPYYRQSLFVILDNLYSSKSRTLLYAGT